MNLMKMQLIEAMKSWLTRTPFDDSVAEHRSQRHNTNECLQKNNAFQEGFSHTQSNRSIFHLHANGFPPKVQGVYVTVLFENNFYLKEADKTRLKLRLRPKRKSKPKPKPKPKPKL